MSSPRQLRRVSIPLIRLPETNVESTITNNFDFDSKIEKTPGGLKILFPGCYRNENELLNDERENSMEDQMKINTKSFYGQKNPNERLKDLRKIQKLSLKQESVVKKRKTVTLVKPKSQKTFIKKKISEREIHVVTATEIENVSSDTGTRKFFRKRSPSKKPKSTLMMGNNKVIFKSARLPPKNITNTNTTVFENDVKETEEIEKIVENIEIPMTVEIFGEPQLEVEIETEVESEEKGETEVENTTSIPFYPLFIKNSEKPTSSPSSPVITPWIRKTRAGRRVLNVSNKKDKMEQLVIDVGQRDVAPVECKTCGMIYTPCDEEDTKTHNKHHNARIQVLNFAGWKKERVVGQYIDGRIILVESRDPSYAQLKINQIVQLLDIELGETMNDNQSDTKYFLFIFEESNMIVGFLSAESLKEAYRVVSDDDDDEVSYLSNKPESVLCGISRLWTLASYRRKSIATRLMDCLRKNFVYGHVMSVNDFAFSGPTIDGTAFASKYTSTNSFLMYK